MTWTYYIEDKNNRRGVIRYSFKCFKVYWAYREWEIESLRSNGTPNSTAISFENYLYSLGYKPYEYSIKERKLIPMGNIFYYSTMGHLHSYYIHPDMPVKTFTIGLNEAKSLPCLINPRPKIECEGIENGYITDAIMQRVHNAYSDEQIYDAIINDKTLVV